MDQLKSLSQAGVSQCCPTCKSEEHNCFQVYAEDNSKLKKMEKVYISWCKNQNDYVLTTINNN